MKTDKTEKILVEPTMRLSELQKAFSRVFPFLKIVLYARPHQIGKHAPGTILHLKHAMIRELDPGFKSKEIILRGNMRTGTFEQEIRRKLGLNVQVLRRSGEHWVETAASDGWTLEEENKKGEQAIMVLPENYYDENSFQDEPYYR